MTVLPSVEDHVSAVVDLLETDGMLAFVEDDWPSSGGWQGTPGQSDFTPMVRVTDMAGPSPTGLLDGVRSDMSFLIHLQCIAATREQANRRRDRVHALMVSGVSVPGRSTVHVVMDMSGETFKDADENPPVYVGWDRYRLFTTPGDE